MKKRRWTTFVLLLVFFIGLSVMLYPALADFWNSRTQSIAIVDYESLLKDIEDTTPYFQEAEEYNQALYNLEYPLINYNEVPNYDNILNVNSVGMMGYITISKIGIELPIYHGTSDSVLNIAVGHLEGSSFPVGGQNSHTVLSAHRGLPSAKLFTDLDRMEVGDTFTITVLDKTLAYQVDQIRIVEPNDTNPISIIEGEDYCTLLTCTPYGINTQRLLVRGKRTDTISHRAIYVTNDGFLIDSLIVTPIVALPILFVLMMIVLFKPVKKYDGGDDI